MRAERLTVLFVLRIVEINPRACFIPGKKGLLFRLTLCAQAKGRGSSRSKSRSKGRRTVTRRRRSPVSSHRSRSRHLTCIAMGRSAPGPVPTGEAGPRTRRAAAGAGPRTRRAAAEAGPRTRRAAAEADPRMRTGRKTSPRTGRRATATGSGAARLTLPPPPPPPLRILLHLCFPTLPHACVHLPHPMRMHANASHVSAKWNVLTSSRRAAAGSRHAPFDSRPVHAGCRLLPTRSHLARAFWHPFLPSPPLPRPPEPMHRDVQQRGDGRSLTRGSGPQVAVAVRLARRRRRQGGGFFVVYKRAAAWMSVGLARTWMPACVR